MDDHLTMLVDDFDNDNFDQSDSSLPKSDFADVICSMPSSLTSTFHSIVQNSTKEVVTINPIFKIEPEVIAPRVIKTEGLIEKKKSDLPTTMINPTMNQDVKVSAIVAPQKRNRGQIDRYNGLTEEEVVLRKLPDYLREGLDMIVVGINPSMTSASVGHHYAGIGNHFWTCITEAGIVPEPVTCYDDYRMIDYGIGFTNVCSRPTKGAAEISRKEMKAGAAIMLEKMRKYRPRIAVFNGKGIYEAFVGHKNFYMGKQPKMLDGTDITVFVMPSSSARCAQLPRAEDKLPFFIALRKLRDAITGRSPIWPPDHDLIFMDYTEFRVTQPDPKSLRKAERRRKRKAEQMLSLSSCSSSTVAPTTLSNATDSIAPSSTASHNNGNPKHLLSRQPSSHANSNQSLIQRKPIVANTNSSNHLNSRQTTLHPNIASKGTLIQPQPQQQHQQQQHQQQQHHHQQHHHQQHQVSIATHQPEYSTITLTTAGPAHDDNQQTNNQHQHQTTQHIEIPLAALFNQQAFQPTAFALGNPGAGGLIGIIPASGALSTELAPQHFLLSQNGGTAFAIATGAGDYLQSSLKQPQPQPIIIQQADGSQAYLVTAAGSSPGGATLLQPWTTGTPTNGVSVPTSMATTQLSGSPTLVDQSADSVTPVSSTPVSTATSGMVTLSTGNGGISSQGSLCAVAPQQMICTSATTLQQLLQQQQQQTAQVQFINQFPGGQHGQLATAAIQTGTPISLQNGLVSVLHQLSGSGAETGNPQDSIDANQVTQQYQLSLNSLSQLLSGAACYTTACPTQQLGQQIVIPLSPSTAAGANGTGGTTYIQLAPSNNGGANSSPSAVSGGGPEDIKLGGYITLATTNHMGGGGSTSSPVTSGGAFTNDDMKLSLTACGGGDGSSSTGSSAQNSVASSNSTNPARINTSTSSTPAGGVSSDLDLITSTSILAALPESSSSSPQQLYHHHHHHHHHHHLQLADCEDQLVQCSSSDEKLVYSAL